MSFVETFFQTIIGTGLIGLFALLVLGLVLSNIFDFSISSDSISEPVEDSPSPNQVEARVAESIFNSLSDSNPVLEPTSRTDVEYMGADGHTITLSHNSSAVDPII